MNIIYYCLNVPIMFFNCSKINEINSNIIITYKSSK